MRLFLDTNVLIDVVMNRKPWVDDALVLFELANQRKLSLFAVDLSFINIIINLQLLKQNYIDILLLLLLLSRFSRVRLCATP